ncbi:MAG: DUF4307 domain-containing protein [Actinomycetales bacterium]
MNTPPVRPAERYGDIRPAWHSTLARVLVVTLAVLGLAWVIWAGWTAATKPVRFTDVGFEVIDDTQVDATFDVTVYSGTTATCTVQALASDFSVVGAEQVEIEVAQEGLTTRQQVSVLTQQRAVTAVVDDCTAPG